MTVTEELMQALKKAIDANTVMVSEDSRHVSEINRLYGEGFPYRTAQEDIRSDSFNGEIEYLLWKVASLCSSDYEKIILISDNALPFALIFTQRSLAKHAEDVLDLPQHKYFFPEDYSWCIFFKMEGDMGVAKPLVE